MQQGREMTDNNEHEAVLELVQYTDPYCTWCWGAEPVLRRIQEVYGGQIRQRFVAGGLVRDMRQFFDAANNIGGPQWYTEVAQHWLEASAQHGMPVDGQVFHDQRNDVFSTHPACIAFKAAQFQGEPLAQRYLRRLREAAAAERKIIQRVDVQVELAEEIGLDAVKFSKDIESGKAAAAFDVDLQECRAAGIGSFPTFIVYNIESGEGVQLGGYQPFERIAAAFDRLAGHALKKTLVEGDDHAILGFVRRHDKVAPREVAVVFGLSAQSTRERLDRLVEAGDLKGEPAGNGFFYTAT